MAKPESSSLAAVAGTASSPSNSNNSNSSPVRELKYKGVRKRKWGKWVSEIRLPHSRERIWLGSYDSAEKAARAFDAAQFCLRGRSANFNFPDNLPDIVGAEQGLSPAEIQFAASQFANNYYVSDGSLQDQVMPMAVGRSVRDEEEAASSTPSYHSAMMVEVEADAEPEVAINTSTSGMKCEGNDVTFVDCDGGVGPYYYDQLDLGLTSMGSGNYVADFGLGDFYTAQPSSDYYYEEEEYGWAAGSGYQNSSLWNF